MFTPDSSKELLVASFSNVADKVLTNGTQN